MSKTLTVQPAPGYMVRDPLTKEPLPATGAAVPDNSFWRRRLREGSVILAGAKAKKAKEG